MRSLLSVMFLGALLSACAAGPDYKRPSVETPAAYKSAQGWRPAAPASADITSTWWTLFGDEQLNAMEQQVAVSNQNLKAAEAAYRQARSLVAEDRASLFPSVDLNVDAARAGGGASTTASRYTASVGATWAPDLWGRIRRTVESSRAQAQASQYDLAAATLSAQSELAVDYIQLRAADEQKRLLDQSIAGEAETLRVAQNRYKVGVAGKSDVASAQAQVASVQAESIDLERQRAALEHAIAVLIGKPPAELTITVADWNMKAPDVPPSVPSALLERRPDIAAAERRAAAASAQIGVAKSAFFPDLTLSGASGEAAASIGALASASSLTWSLGATAAETLLDFGRRRAAVRGARAGYDQAVAQYRQSVLTAFQNVEDALTAERVLAQEQTYRDQGAAAAAEAERIALNQYRAGTIDHSALIVAQNAAHDARISALNVASSRLTNTVSLIEALGGGWRSNS